MNDLFYTLGIESWKGFAGQWLLPPLVLLLLVVLGALLLRRRPWLGGMLLWPGVAALWLCSLPVVADVLSDVLTPSPPVLGAEDQARLRADRRVRTAIVVLGSGRIEMALEYGAASPKPYTLERLRYGLWLAGRTGLPVAYTGGPASGSPSGPTEAAVAQRVAAEEFRRPLRWVEDRARDTTENGRFTVALLHAEGIERIVLVTHGFHMRRALRAFERAAASAGTPMQLLPAPLGLQPRGPWTARDWWPNTDAWVRVHIVLREWLGYVAGA
jgi:uncharacterized SAM-binding protein YcdF (DUF218 family)